MSEILFLFFFNDTATTEIYTLSLHDALPISENTTPASSVEESRQCEKLIVQELMLRTERPSSTVNHHSMLGQLSRDRKSTRLNSSHANISYAVFCLKKKTCIITKHQ